jgi:hypothetical protein
MLHINECFISLQPNHVIPSVFYVVENIFTNNTWIISVQNVLLLELFLSSHISKKNTASIFSVVQVLMDYPEGGGSLENFVPYIPVCMFVVS